MRLLDESGFDHEDDGDDLGLTALDREMIEQCLRELDKRQKEALNLYKPLPFQEQYHASRCPKVMMVKGNHVGGTLCGCAEDARAMLGKDPHHKYPEKDGLLVMLGFGEKHIGRIFHKYLFRPGAFEIIRDDKTHLWRPFRPWAADVMKMGKFGDEGREGDALPAPPLIPERYIKNISWEKKSERIFSEIELTTGWRGYALNSAGDYAQAQGFRCDSVHIDEDLATGGWMPELVGRLKKGGLIRWTAVPQARTDDMQILIEEAEDEVGAEKPSAIAIPVTIYDNPYLDDETREMKVKAWKSQGEDVFRQRALGKLTLESTFMYPAFDKDVHNAIRSLTLAEEREEADGKVMRPKAVKILTEERGEPPADWCRYITFDPGATVAHITFWCVPPPHIGDHAIVYDEARIENCTAKKFGEVMEHKCRNREFEAFIIDEHGGRLRDFGSGLLPKLQYEQQLKDRGISCNKTGHRFIAGSDDIKGREMKLRDWLEIRPDGSTKFMICSVRCPHTVRTMQKFKKKTTRVGGKDVVTDDGNRRGDVHAAECLEYGAAHGLEYVRPKNPRQGTSYVSRLLKERKLRERQRKARHRLISGNSRISLGEVEGT